MTRVGIAHCAFADRLVREEPGLVDYVEIPFEQLMHNPRSGRLVDTVPVILHCASLSMASAARPGAQITDAVAHWAQATRTPWIGEHLSYVRADGLWQEIAEHEALVDDGAAATVSGPFNVGYTVSPQYSQPVIECIAEHWTAHSEAFGLPILLENGPIYFEMPGSTMSQGQFVSTLCARLPNLHLLLDLAHLLITAQNTDADPMDLLDAYPLERVTEVHLSGLHREAGTTWDDHATRAPDAVYAMLDRMLERHRPLAITLEYNWDASFPTQALIEDIGRVRSLLSRHEH